MDLSQTKRIRKAAQTARESGRVADAARLYGQVLALDPCDAEALHWLGAFALMSGDRVRARPLLERAATLRPHDAQCLYHLAEAQRASGDFEASIASYRRASRLARGVPDIARGLGLALGALGRWTEAAAALSEARTLAAEDTDTALPCLHALVLAGAREDAGRLWRQLCDNNLPPSQLARTAAAIARELRDAGRNSEALEWYAHACETGAADAPILHDYGVALAARGRFADAVAAFRGAVQLDPGMIGAWENLAMIGDAPLDGADRAILERLAQAADVDEPGRARALFALGRLLEREGAYDAAFDVWARANALKRKHAPFDIGAHEAFVERLVALCDRAFFEERRDFGVEDTLPVLIVGMPRSGTTLVEQILAAHPQVAAGGERDELRALARRLPELAPGARPFPEGLLDLDRDAVRSLAHNYLAVLRALAGPSVRFVTDKLPGNYVRLAMIGLALPRARIVWCRRDVRDVCMSCFATDFARGLRFSTDIGDCARVWLAHDRLMRHWQTVLPNTIVPLDYERLVEAPEPTIRDLLGRMELTFDQRCLQFHDQERDIETASLWQARQPIYRSSVGRWRRFASRLAALGPLLDGEENRCSNAPSFS